MSNQSQALGQRCRAGVDVAAAERLFAGVVSQALLDAEAGEPLAQYWLRYWTPQLWQEAGKRPERPNVVRTTRTHSI